LTEKSLVYSISVSQPYTVRWCFNDDQSLLSSSRVCTYKLKPSLIILILLQRCGSYSYICECQQQGTLPREAWVGVGLEFGIFAFKPTDTYADRPPNSTGAYELDLTLVNQYQLAYREMHVKTDLFCGSNVVLPDKAGRQISIGGYNGVALSGVRLYTPDGGPGVNGKNDWEENYQILSLQVQLMLTMTFPASNSFNSALGGTPHLPFWQMDLSLLSEV